MKNYEDPELGKVSMDIRVRYSNSIGQFLNEKRRLRMTDKEEAEYQAKRRAMLQKLRESGYRPL